MPSLSGLVVGAVAAADDFAVAALRGHPGFEVVFFGCDGADVACADVDDVVGQFEFLEKLLGSFLRSSSCIFQLSSGVQKMNCSILLN